MVVHRVNFRLAACRWFSQGAFNPAGDRNAGPFGTHKSNLCSPRESLDSAACQTRLRHRIHLPLIVVAGFFQPLGRSAVATNPLYHKGSRRTWHCTHSAGYSRVDRRICPFSGLTTAPTAAGATSRRIRARHVPQDGRLALGTTTESSLATGRQTAALGVVGTGPDCDCWPGRFTLLRWW